MKKTECLIRSKNKKNLYRVVRTWFDTDTKELDKETSYAIRFDGCPTPAWANIKNFETAEKIMIIPTNQSSSDLTSRGKDCKICSVDYWKNFSFLENCQVQA